MNRGCVIGLLAWSLTVATVGAQSYQAWSGHPRPGYYPIPYPVPASAYPLPGYPLPASPLPAYSRPYPAAQLSRQGAAGVQLMPAPPLPVLSSERRASAVAQAPASPDGIGEPPQLPGQAPNSSPRLTPPAEEPLPPPGEILPLPREALPAEPYADIAPFGPGSAMIRDDGLPDVTPDCPPNAPRGHRYYGRAEYLMWFGQPQSAPVLLTQGAAAVPIVGGGDIHLIAQTRHGGRFTLGHWLNNCQDLGIEVVGFFIGGDDANYERTSTGTPLLARPFINGVTGLPDQSVIAAPGSPGVVDIGMFSRLWGLEGNVRCEICRWGCGHLDALGGVRFIDFGENLTVLTRTNTRRGAAFAYDDFGSRNLFIGAQAGLECELIYRKWFLDSWAKIALGDNSEQMSIQGNRVIGGRALPGGLLAQPSNIGQYRRDQFGYVPEVAICGGYRIQEHVRALVGYNFLLLGNVARPGNQIDTRINTTGAGPAVPNFSFNQGEFWMHGLIAGLEFHF